MIWRDWIFDMVSSDLVVQSWADDRVWAAGAIEETPKEHPFLLILLGAEIQTAVSGVTFRDLEIQVHDDPGSFLRIDEIIQSLEDTLTLAPAESGMLAVEWQSNGPDTVDPGYGTFVRSTFYRLVSKRQEVA